MLLLSVIFLNVITTLYAKPANQSGQIADELIPRILYGEKANILDYPYFAALPKLCGAAIISESWLVTAAHCVDAMKNYLVWVGGDSIKTSQLYTIDYNITHPGYARLWTIQVPVNDISLLHLSRPLTFSDTVQPLNLPLMNYAFNAEHKFAGKGCDQTNQLTPYLMSMNVRTLKEEDCLYGLSFLNQTGYSLIKSHFDQIKDVTICTERIKDLPGACSGDSGSPLVRDNTLVGIASWIPDECSKTRVSMFTNVAPYVKWIQQVTGVGLEYDYEDYYEVYEYPIYT